MVSKKHKVDLIVRKVKEEPVVFLKLVSYPILQDLKLPKVREKDLVTLLISFGLKFIIHCLIPANAKDLNH